ncbi:hypothetical protein [Paraburkholderia youngii]|uniref:hypothetical protein n=1 Tax=Paraburkholderia youngii TaxID=2782701 RepID=UPI0015924F55|nr:hypothetical protein [Paraburkholderia youngii]NUX59448.1 hypothetical protein [Paraburkholderia youngii]
MSLQLTDRLRENLEWLASNWEAKQLQHISSFNNEFHAALLSVLAGNVSRPELELLIEGTRGKAADGYAHLLVVDPERVAEEPFIALRILGDISTDLAQIAAAC